MLNRRKRIQKYITALKSKKSSLASSSILQYSLIKKKQNDNDKQIANQKRSSLQICQKNKRQKQIITKYICNQDKMQNSLQQEDIQEDQLWHDSDQESREQNQIKINAKNMTMLKKLNLNCNHTQKDFQEKLKTFYQNRYKIKNWAEIGEGQIQMDINDYLAHEQHYQQKENFQAKDQIKVKKKIIHIGRTHQRHESIVTGMDWSLTNLLFTSGFDQKIKIFKINQEQENPDLKIKLQKDVLIDKLPLSNVHFQNGQIYCGTLRKNLVMIDPVKWKVNYVTSSFLSDHQSYQNLRITKQHSKKLIFSKNKVSLLDYKNGYTGSLLANDQLKDVKFGILSHELFGITQNAIYQWDLRTFKPVRIDKTLLGYSALQVSKQWLCLGSQLGLVYVNENLNSSNKNVDGGTKISSSTFPLHHENKNLTTTITGLHFNNNNSLVLSLSKWKQNSARVMDINTGKSLGNWPNAKTKIQFPSSGAFSSHENMFAIGSTNGYANIFDFESDNMK